MERRIDVFNYDHIIGSSEIIENKKDSSIFWCVVNILSEQLQFYSIDK